MPSGTVCAQCLTLVLARAQIIVKDNNTTAYNVMLSNVDLTTGVNKFYAIQVFRCGAHGSRPPMGTPPWRADVSAGEVYVRLHEVGARGGGG